MLNRIFAFFQYAKISDVVDIGIIAVFTYLILVWLKKARARFIFIGIIMMGVLYALARAFGFYLTRVALQAFFAVALIMIAIIFQDDLRHFFERIAIFGVARRHRTARPYTQNIEMLSSALASLSRKKMGALIVLRGTDPLDRHLEAGVIVDAVISQVLLESIFDRHAPSHDGAVVIDAGRLTKLGCHLPLSTNIKEVGRLGTRHAAALGIAERTDAIALVVSEEEGGISVAEDGRIRQFSDIAHLNNALKDFFRKKFPEKKHLDLKRFLTEHYPEKIIAVLIACSLWVAFGHRTESIRRDFVVPIEYRNLAANRIINEPKAKEVTVTLSGTEQEFNLVKPADLKMSLDMAAIKDGENEVGLSHDLVRNSAGLKVVNIHPDEITLNSYKLVPVVVPVGLKTKGDLPPGVVMRGIRTEPESVSIMIPSTMSIDDADVSVEPVDLAAISEATTIVSKLIAAPDIRFAGEKAPEIKVIIDIEKREGPDENKK